MVIQMKHKKIFAIIAILLITLIVISIKDDNSEHIAIKTHKESIYKLFYNFPESNNIYFTSNNLYSERSIGPAIYQIDILAELTDDAYKEFIKNIKFDEVSDFAMKINPHKQKYQWKKISNIEIIKSKSPEDASIQNIYLDETTKSLYIIAVGGN